MAQKTKKDSQEIQAEQQSSQDPTEGRRDVPEGNPSKQGYQTEPKHSVDLKSGNKGITSNEDPAEGRR